MTIESEVMPENIMKYGEQSVVVFRKVTKVIEEQKEMFISPDILSKINELEAKIKKMESEICIRNISDTLATEEIKSYIRKKKKNGIKKISIIDITEELNIPVDQIERVMDSLEGERI